MKKRLKKKLAKKLGAYQQYKETRAKKLTRKIQKILSKALKALYPPKLLAELAYKESPFDILRKGLKVKEQWLGPVVLGELKVDRLTDRI